MRDRDHVRPQSILIQPAGALGDTLLTYPSVDALRTWAPRARITLAARSAYGALALSAGIVDQVVDVDGFATNAGSGAVSPDPPELAVLWSSAYRDAARRFEAHGTTAIMAAPPFPGDLRHQARYLLDCLRPLGVPRTLTQAPAPILPSLSLTERLLLGREGPTVVLHPGAGARWKQWPIEFWSALANGLQLQGISVRWSHGPDDEEVHEALQGRRPRTTGVVWPLLPLPRFAALLAHCALFVSADSGPAHLAALMRTPQVTLFGPSDPRRWRPISRFATLVRAPDLCGGRWEPVADEPDGPPRLRRCVDYSTARCPCLAALPVDSVLSQALRLLFGTSSTG